MIRQVFIAILFIFFSSSNSSIALEKITLQLKWKHQFQFAGYYAAIEKGFYFDEGLTVGLIEGKPGGNEVEDVVSGIVNYGIGMSDILINRVNGLPIVVIANIFQHSPAIILTKEDSGILNIHDLYDRNLMLVKGYKSAEIRAMFLQEGLDETKINILQPTWNLDDLINDNVDAVAAYISSEPFKLKQKNIGYKIIRPMRYGIDFYGDNIFTSEAEIKEHPERVSAFRRASLKGWDYALQHPDEIIDIILKKYGPGNKELNKKALANEAAEYQKLILPNFVKLGHTNPGRWIHIADTYKKLGIIQTGYTLKGFIYNPTKKIFDWNHPFIKIGSLLIALGLLIALILFIFNHRLRKEINERSNAEQSLRESQDRYYRVVNTIQDAIVIVNQNGIIQFVNSAFCDLYQYSKKEIIGMQASRLMHPEFHKELERFVKEIEQTGNFSGSTVDVRKDGTTFHTNVRGLRIIFEGEHCFFALVRDITKSLNDEKALIAEKEKLEKALDETRKANSAKSHFLAGMSHELRTPLNAIIGFSGILENQHFGKLNKKQTNYVNDILESGQHLLSLINEILDLSKVEAGEMLFEPEFLNINDLVENSLLMIREKALKHGIELQFKGDEKLTVAKIYADEKKMKQTLYNLNSNAVKFTPSGGKISLSTHYISNYGELKESFKILVVNEQDSFPAVVICVKDTGSGIPFEMTQNIFKKFFQASQGYSDKTPGTGLGLPLTKKFVQMHKGKIWVESEGKDKGSRFFVFLPAKMQENITKG
ncbi:MAG: ABC transporter substrate-binding protein [Desulfobacula sp.]|nr:ABC transporter substrate-binding protein [Desulfobacula sp.]